MLFQFPSNDCFRPEMTANRWRASGGSRQLPFMNPLPPSILLGTGRYNVLCGKGIGSSIIYFSGIRMHSILGMENSIASSDCIELVPLFLFLFFFFSLSTNIRRALLYFLFREELIVSFLFLRWLFVLLEGNYWYENNIFIELVQCSNLIFISSTSN